MRLTIKPYVRNLIKENGIYIAGLWILIALTIFVYIYNSQRFAENSDKILTLEKEVLEYQQKAKVINAALSVGDEALESYLQVVNSLVPDVEDYFSIVYALEEIAKKTNFVIKSYSINIKTSTKNKLQLSIVGVGNDDAFMEFLKNYTFSSGRLIAIERIELTPQFAGSMTLSVNFYNKTVEISPSEKAKFNEDTLAQLKSIKDKITFIVKEPEEATASGYATKTNPF